MRGLLLLLALAMLPMPGFGDSDSDNADIWTLLASQSQASGRFLQELYSEKDELLERSSGRYAVLRPGFFRWEIDYPDRQLIVVAGDELWHYDIDLAAATRRDTDESQDFSALELLAGDSEALRSRFTVEGLGDGRFRLIPTYAQAGFTAVEIAWEGGAVVSMAVQDRSGQTISLALTPDDDPPLLGPADFSFVPPEGVDVYNPGEF